MDLHLSWGQCLANGMPSELVGHLNCMIDGYRDAPLIAPLQTHEKESHMAKKKSARKDQLNPATPTSVKPTSMPEVTKQTAGGVGGAVLGAAVAGPVGAVIGGVAGTLIGDASAKGKRPVKKAVEAVGSRLSASRSAGSKKKATAAKKSPPKKAKKSKGAKGATKKKAKKKASAGKKAKKKAARKK